MNWSWPDAKSTIGVILAASLIILIVILICYPSQIDQHPAILAVLTGLVGGLSSNLTTVVQYFFGSSLGSKQKDDVIAQIATTNSPPPPIAPKIV